MSEQIRVALIGFGGMGHFHVAQYKGQTNCRLVAICDTNPEQFKTLTAEINLGNSGSADLAGVNTYLSYEELVAKEEFDMLDICLPCHLHCEYAVRAMRDGYHVLSEKPMGRDLKQATKMVATSYKYSRYLMVAQCVRFMAPYEYIKESYDSGRYGKLLRMDMRRCGNLPKQAWYRDPAKSGGALLDLHLHDTDFINSMLGKPDAVMTFGVERDTGGIDDLLTNYIYNDGPCVSSEGSWCRGRWQPGTVAVFEKATLEVDGETVRVYRLDNPEAEIKDFRECKNGYFREIDYLTGCIRDGKKLTRCTPESTRESIKIALAEERSARSKRKVAIA